MTRVLLSTDAVGGVWRYSLELAAGLQRQGHATVLAVLGPEPTTIQRREAARVPNLRLVATGHPLDWTASSPGALHRTARCLADLAGHTDVDSVQLHAPALVGSTIWPVPLIVTMHSCVATWWHAVHGGALPPDLAWRAAAAADGLAAADAVIAPSHSFAADLRACYGLTRDIRVVPNGRAWMMPDRDLPVWPAGPSRPPAKPTRQRIVLTAGRLWDEGKGVAVLDAAARLIAHPIYAAGALAGPHRAAPALFPHLVLLGSLDEATLTGWYGMAAVFASVSRYEPFGLAILEAAQAGCALVLSDIPTFRELWHDAAVFVPPDDPVALAGALQGLLGDAAAAARMGRLARQRARRFDPQRMADATWQVHATVLAREAT